MMNLFLYLQTDPVKQIFGSGVTDVPFGGGTVDQGFSQIFGFGLNMVLVVGALFTIIYMLWGAIDYITSAGDADKVATARKKMINAAMGMIIIIAVIMVWLVLVRDVLNIFGGEGGGFEFKLPNLREATQQQQGPSPTQPAQPSPIYLPRIP